MKSVRRPMTKDEDQEVRGLTRMGDGGRRDPGIGSSIRFRYPLACLALITGTLMNAPALGDTRCARIAYASYCFGAARLISAQFEHNFHTTGLRIYRELHGAYEYVIDYYFEYISERFDSQYEALYYSFVEIGQENTINVTALSREEQESDWRNFRDICTHRTEISLSGLNELIEDHCDVSISEEMMARIRRFDSVLRSAVR